MKTENRKKKIALIADIGRSMATLWIVLSFCSLSLALFQEVIFRVALYGVGIAAVLVYYVMQRNRRYRRYMYTGTGAVCLVLLIAGIYPVMQGFLTVTNFYCTQWNKTFNDCVLLFTTKESGDAVIFCFLLLLLLLLLMIEDAILERGWIWAQTFICLCLLFPPVIFGLKGSIPVFLFAVLGWGFLVGLELLTGKSGWFRKGCLIAGIVFSVAVALIGVLLGKEVRKQLYVCGSHLANSVEQWRYGSQKMPEGDVLSALIDVQNADEKILTIAGKGKIEDFYLKAYVGAEYENGEWKELSKLAYTGANSGIMDWLEENEFDLSNHYAQSMLLQNPQLPVQRIQVENTGADRSCVYAPYNYLGMTESGSKLLLDWQLQSVGLRGDKSYAYQIVSGGKKPEELFALCTAQQKPEEVEEVYWKFVQEQYLDVDEDTKSWITSHCLKGSDDTDPAVQLSEVVDHVRKFLQERENSDDSNQIADAGIMTMALRVAGFPARYVEGYYLPKEMAEENMDGEENWTVAITNENLAAWTEVYVSGYGWLPVSVDSGTFAASIDWELLEQSKEEPTESQQEEVPEVLTESEPAVTESAAEGQPHSTQKIARMDRIVMQVVVTLYVVLLIFVLMEVQRLIRKRVRFLRMQKSDVAAYAGKYLPVLLELMHIRVEEELWDVPESEIVEKCGADLLFSFQKTVRLIAKEQAGLESLTRSENRSVRTFLCTMENLTLAGCENTMQRLVCRYWYAL